jgi:DNA-directed RNA polymerase alpha subunit
VEQVLLSCIESRIENNRSFYGRFQLGPFDLGQGLTVATALRRTLLSELTGIAITAVTIQGASHEYSTLHGVRESVLDILLNLKQIVFSRTEFPLSLLRKSKEGENLICTPTFKKKIKHLEKTYTFYEKKSLPSLPGRLENNFVFDFSTHQENLMEPQIGFLKVCGPGIVKARDIKLPNTIQCVDPEQYIATLSYNGTLEIKFIISEGKNYSTQVIPPLKLLSLSPEISNSDMSLFSKSQSLSTSQSPVFNQNQNLITNSKNLLDFNLNKNQTNNNHTDITFKSINLKKEKSFQKEHFNLEQFDRKKTQNKLFKIDKETNILLIDAVFMPVNRVNFLLENDEEITKSKEKIILEVWTNGSIHPRKAIHQAALALIKLILPFQANASLNFSSLALNKKTYQKLSEPVPQPDLDLNQRKIKFVSKKDALAIKNRTALDIGNLELSLRPYTCLKRANINTVSDLLQYSADELLVLKNFGNRSLEEVETSLAQLGLKLSRYNSSN